jgi:hypothetical protein
MSSRSASVQLAELTLIALLLVLLLLLSPLRQWWAALDAPWYAPYLLWAFIILLGAGLQYWPGGRETGDGD